MYKAENNRYSEIIVSIKCDRTGNNVTLLHPLNLISPDVTGYALDSRTGAWPQQVKFTLPGNLFTYLGFPECPCCLKCNSYSRLCHDYGLMLFD